MAGVVMNHWRVDALLGELSTARMTLVVTTAAAGRSPSHADWAEFHAKVDEIAMQLHREHLCGSPDVPIIMSPGHVRMRNLVISLDHVHREDGYCLRNRFGSHCALLLPDFSDRDDVERWLTR